MILYDWHWPRSASSCGFIVSLLTCLLSWLWTPSGLRLCLLPRVKNRVFHIHCVDVSSWFGLIADLCYRWWLRLTLACREVSSLWCRFTFTRQEGTGQCESAQGRINTEPVYPQLLTEQRLRCPHMQQAGWVDLPPVSPLCQANETWSTLGSFYPENVHHS